MEKKLNEQESLQLISEMIAQAKNNLRKEDAFSFLFIGYGLVITSILDAILLYVLTPSYMAHYVWLLMAPIIFYSFYKSKKDNREAAVRTHIDAIITGTWKAFMYAMGVIFLLLFGFSSLLNDWNMMLLITPAILVLMGFAQFVTAVACRYKPFYWGAAIFWIGTLLCLLYFYITREAAGQYIIFALCVIGGFIIPGHKLNKKA